MTGPDDILTRRAVALAGSLAERGVTRLVLHVPGHEPKPLYACQTDLPGVIVEAAQTTGAVLELVPHGERITLESIQGHGEADRADAGA